MKNIVPCKRCTKEFEYSPGFAGNVRQLCKECRRITNDEEVEQLKEETIMKGNRYLDGKQQYDPTDILVDGNIPKFESDLDRFLCIREVAFFARKISIVGLEDNLVKLFDELDIVHIGIFFKQQSLQRLESMSKDERFKKSMSKLYELCIKNDLPRISPDPREPILCRTQTGWECKLSYK